MQEKAQDYFELMLPSGWYVALPMTLARALGYLNHKYQLSALHQINRCSVVQLIEDQSLTLLATTTTLSRKEQFFWGNTLTRRCPGQCVWNSCRMG